MNNTDRIKFLEETHRVLDQRIANEFKNLSDTELVDLKKKKLQLKEQIENLKKNVDC